MYSVLTRNLFSSNDNIPYTHVRAAQPHGKRGLPTLSTAATALVNIQIIADPVNSLQRLEKIKIALSEGLGKRTIIR